MNAILQNLTRPFLYSVTLVLGLSLAFEQLNIGQTQNFYVVVFIISLILLIEIFTSWLWYRVHHPQVRINIVDKYDQLTHWMHHILLPVIAFYSGAIFVYYNQSQTIRWPMYLVNVFLFTILFYNLRSYFEKDLLQESISHYIYDILKMYLFFVISNVLANAVLTDIRTVLIPLIMIGLAGLFTLLGMRRKQWLSLPNLLLTITLSIGIGVLNLFLLRFTSLTPIQFGLVNILGYYFVNATIHHQISKSLGLRIVLEYLLIMALVVSILINLN